MHAMPEMALRVDGLSADRILAASAKARKGLHRHMHGSVEHEQEERGGGTI